MRRGARRCGWAAALLLLPTAALATDASIEITLDKAKVIRMPAHAQTIVVGNPSIADVTTLKIDGLVVVTGKGFGETNMIFLDKTGTAVEESSVTVVAGTSQVTVQRGNARESYSCQPRCQPTVALGDDQLFLGVTSAQIQSRNALAVPASH